MPRPPILPTVNWKTVFESGTEWSDWLKRGEAPEHQQAMEEARKELDIGEEIRSFLNALPKPVYVVAIAEDWCGDVVRHAPVLQAMADAAPNLHVHYIFREDSPDTFVRFLTNGGEAIPKFVFLSDQWVECGNWGPMPYACKDVIARGKACGDVSEARVFTSEMYAADPDRRVVIEELADHIDIAASTVSDPKESLMATKTTVG